ncbi:aminodeoxychorismate/anthranilate synthase [Corynebacterium sp. 35RC1]|nr:aminodeoxychorismate/anthranilate synthase [Corynebacterium sp. 35RC1]
MILVVDNHDSFTFNLVELLRGLGEQPHVIANNDPLPDLSRYTAAILSPGPGRPEHPEDIGISTAVLASGIPVLGVCLGFQAIAHFHGGTVELAPTPVHGFVDTITHTGSPLFAGIPQSYEVVRYHSLVVGRTDMEVLATNGEGIIMAGVIGNHWGVQFHPESICSTFGEQLIANFLALATPTWHRERRNTHADPLSVFRAASEGKENAVLLEFGGEAIIAVSDAPSVTLDAVQVRAARSEAERGVGPGWFGCKEYEGSERFFYAAEVIVIRESEVELIATQAGHWFTQAWAMIEHVAGTKLALGHLRFGALEMRDTHERYLEMIEQCQELIRQGETYEVCLTTQLSCTVEGDPLAVYAKLRNVTPAPMRSFLRLGDFAVASVSPERYLSIRCGAGGGVTGRVISSEPIKGTRPRGNTPGEDARLAEDLGSNPKDRAENLMVVDLVRHDLAQVGRNVRVPELFAVRTFPGVHQLVSTIEADLAAPIQQSVRVPFPGGSMTGAPKQRTMEIINELESGPRGVYSGCIGWVSELGEADLAMAIRTAVIHNGRLSYGVGGAIIALSEPAKEYQELHTKARPLLELVGQPFPGVEVVESFIVREGAVQGWDLHIQRLRRGCALMGIPIGEEAEQALRTLRFPEGTWWPRLSMSAGGLQVTLREVPQLREETVLGAVECEIAHPEVKGPEFALLTRLRRKGEQVLLRRRAGLESRGVELIAAETTSGSLVAFDSQGMVVMDAPRLASVTEALVREIAQAMEIPVRAEALTLGQLQQKEVWVLNAVHGITPARWADGTPNPVNAQRLAQFRRRLEHSGWQAV